MTYGAEHELSDWDRSLALPDGCDIDDRDVTMVNSNGIAVDPKAISYQFGGEVRSRPTTTAMEQGDILAELVRTLKPAINYRSNLHVHIRVSRLSKDLQALKRISRYNQQNLREALELIEPIPKPDKNDVGAMRRYRRRKVSHHTVLTDKRYKKQQSARSVQKFLEAEVPQKSDGTPLWHLAPRCAVNLRQLRETDTIEFRHWPGTLQPKELVACVKWCAEYLKAALYGGPSARELYSSLPYTDLFPTFPEYDHTLETRYRATCHDHTLSRKEIEHNIALILSGEFDDFSPMPR